MHDFLIAALAFIVLIGLMVVVHEFGHFAVAKLCGVRVEAFSVGFGPRLFGVKVGDTDYKVCALPLGGFVKMAGEIPGEDQALDDPGAFNAHPRWQRMLIGLAGPVANFILAFALMGFYFTFINEVPSLKTVTLEWVSPGSAAWQAGFRTGDVLTGFADQTNPDLATFLETATDELGHTVPISVRHGDRTLTANFRISKDDAETAVGFADTGIFPSLSQNPILVDDVQAGQPAARAGLQSGDAILAVDGYPFHTLNPMVDYLNQGKGKPVVLTVKRNGAVRPVTVYPFEKDPGQWRIGFGYGFQEESLETRPMPLGKALTTSADYCRENSLMIVHVLQRLLTRQTSVKQLSGPVGIAHIAGQAAQTHYWSEKFNLAASISLNLGILNLMPFPILDGGLILLLLIESLIRRDISMDVKERIYQAAFVMIVVFFVVVSYNDVTRLLPIAGLKH